MVVSTLIVAPHTGAWIETTLHAHKTHKEIVAPHTGAWIETKIRLAML